ncbi:hypothetical protein JKP88DRAFT_257987 [Tribonema minus]|uniref:Uncharacterized protein n=1 Tax=Tribonema minus TaxID=303371 RepID=A0A836CDA0_9STRA|nr:hypothetical protein JKP88DRAFT_257987 [Tribonema minus]
MQTASTEAVAQYFDEFDFCLDSMDSALSGPSMTKALNRQVEVHPNLTKTNILIKNVLILNSPEDHGPAERELTGLLGKFETAYATEPGYAEARAYLDAVCALGLPGPAASPAALDALAPNYMQAYRRVLSVLGDFGCAPLAPGAAGRAAPADADICLSVLDAIVEGHTKTKALNALSNRVVRTMCVGNDDDLACLAREMGSKRTAFMTKWVGGAQGGEWEGSQEDVYYQALIELLSNGLTAGARGLRNPWANAYARVVAALVRELGARRTPASSRVLTSFVTWESELRRTLRSAGWDENPLDLVGVWAVGDDMDLLPDYAPVAALSSGGGGGAAAAGGMLRVMLKRDGSAEIPDNGRVKGLRWRLDPGPTHLDTLRFEVRQAAGGGDALGGEEGALLSYTGYVDRGARIEARFSRRPLKMTGRLTRVVRGEQRPSTRFSMRLVERED